MLNACQSEKLGITAHIRHEYLLQGHSLVFLGRLIYGKDAKKVRYVQNMEQTIQELSCDVEELQFPYSPGPDLYDLESYYKMLDLYFQFSRKVGLPVQEENLVEERRNTEEEISRILKTECASYTRKCTICGRELSWDYPFSICERCFERGKRVHPRRR